MLKIIYQLSFEHNGHGGLRDQIVKVVEKTQSSIVRFQSYVPEDRHSSHVLGSIRQGTGVILNPHGYILTVGYLIMEATEIQVITHEDQIIPAEVTGIDYESGLGMIRLTEPVDVTPITLGRASQVTAGQLTVTIGESTENRARIVTNGRIFDTAPFIGYWEYLLERALYVVPQNPAFGGSPLFNIEGEMIGVVSLQLNQQQGMNLAIPIDLLYEVEGELIQYGRVMSRKPKTWTGIYHAPFQRGIIVVDVMPDGPADRGGVQKGDIVTHVNGVRVRTEEQFLRKIWENPIDAPFEITVLRHNVPRVLEIRGMDFYDFYDLGGSNIFFGH